MGDIVLITCLFSLCRYLATCFALTHQWTTLIWKIYLLVCYILQAKDISLFVNAMMRYDSITLYIYIYNILFNIVFPFKRHLILLNVIQHSLVAIIKDNQVGKILSAIRCIQLFILPFPPPRLVQLLLNMIVMCFCCL